MISLLFMFEESQETVVARHNGSVAMQVSFSRGLWTAYQIPAPISGWAAHAMMQKRLF